MDHKYGSISTSSNELKIDKQMLSQTKVSFDVLLT